MPGRDDALGYLYLRHLLLSPLEINLHGNEGPFLLRGNVKALTLLNQTKCRRQFGVMKLMLKKNYRCD